MSSNDTNFAPLLPPSPSPPTPPTQIPYYWPWNIDFPPITNSTGITYSDSNSGSSTSYSRFFTVAVICLAVVSAMVLFLHLYLRYVRQQHMLRHRRQTANLLHLTTFNLTHNSDSPRAGLDRTAISTIPSFQYQKEADSSTEHSTASAASAECAVCLSSLEEGEVVRMLPACHHVFHVACIDKWLTSNASCPVCRAEVSPQTQLPGRTQSRPRSSRSRSQSVVLEATEAPAQEQSGTKEETEAGTSVSARLGSSFRRMLSSNRSSRRVQDDAVVGDLERGNGANYNN